MDKKIDISSINKIDLKAISKSNSLESHKLLNCNFKDNNQINDKYLNTEESYIKTITRIITVAIPLVLTFICLSLLATFMFYLLSFEPIQMTEGYSLCLLYFNCIIIGIFWGGTLGYQILGAQALGSKKYNLLTAYHYQILFISTFGGIFMALISVFLVPKLISLMNPDVIALEYFNSLIISFSIAVIFFSLFQANMRLATILKNTFVCLYSSFIGCIIQGVVAYVLFYNFNMGISSIGIGYTINFVYCLLFFSYYNRRKAPENYKKSSNEDYRLLPSSNYNIAQSINNRKYTNNSTKENTYSILLKKNLNNKNNSTNEEEILPSKIIKPFTFRYIKLCGIIKLLKFGAFPLANYLLFLVSIETVSFLGYLVDDITFTVLTILMNILSVIVVISEAISCAMTSIISDNLGNKKNLRKMPFQNLYSALIISIIVQIIMIGSLIVFPNAILSIFSKDKEFLSIAHSAIYLFSVAISLNSFHFLFAEFIIVFGNHKLPFYALLIGKYLVQIGCALILIPYLKLIGIILAMILGQSVCLIIFVIYIVKYVDFTKFNDSETSSAIDSSENDSYYNFDSSTIQNEDNYKNVQYKYNELSNPGNTYKNDLEAPLL